MVDVEPKPARPAAGTTASGPAVEGVPAGSAPQPDPLIDEAIKKASVAWVSVSGGSPSALWCLPISGQLYVVSGPGEQAAPGLSPGDGGGPATGTGTATVTLRGDHGGRIVSWPAQVVRVLPDTEEWATVAPQLAGKRLNASGTAEALVARWAAECAIHRLSPAGAPLEAGSTLPDASHAEPPRESQSTRPTRRPFRLHRVRRR